MTVSISRRELLVGAWAVCICRSDPLLAQEASSGLTWQTVAEKLVGAAISYFGGKAMQSMFDTDMQPTNTDVINAIRASSNELKRYFSADVREAISENNILQLESQTRAIHRNLERYSKLPPASRAQNRYLLEDSDLSSSRAVSMASTYGPLALPAFANLVTLRTVAMRAFHELEQDDRAYRNYGTELANFSTFLIDSVYARIERFHPDLRLGKQECKITEAGLQLRTRTAECAFTVDGQALEENKMFAFVPNNSEQQFWDRADKFYADKRVELLRFQEDANRAFAQPLLLIARQWAALSMEIDPGNSLAETMGRSPLP